MSAKLLDLSTLSEGQVRRVKELRRAFQRSLNHMPTTIQRTLLDRAAVLTAKAEAAALDPNVCANDVVRLDNVAERARREMYLVLQATRKESLPTFRGMFGEVQA